MLVAVHDPGEVRPERGIIRDRPAVFQPFPHAPPAFCPLVVIRLGIRGGDTHVDGPHLCVPELTQVAEALDGPRLTTGPAQGRKQERRQNAVPAARANDDGRPIGFLGAG